jgi:hypothetical protein
MIARICRRGKPKGKIAIANDSARRLFESTPMVQCSPLERDFYLRLAQGCHGVSVLAPKSRNSDMILRFWVLVRVQSTSCRCLSSSIHRSRMRCKPFAQPLLLLASDPIRMTGDV